MNPGEPRAPRIPRPNVRTGRCLSLVISLCALGQAAGAAQSTPPLFPNRSFTLGSGPTDSLLADFNHDGHLDLAVVDFAVRVSFGRGDGTFDEPQVYPLLNYGQSMFASDVTGDGLLDLVVHTFDNALSLEILRGRPDGLFEAPVRQSMPTVVAVEDLSGDAVGDLLTWDFTTLGVQVNGGSGTFRPREILPTGASPTVVTLADFNEDGIRDLAVGNWGCCVYDISLLLGVGNARFEAQPRIPVDFLPESLIAGDFDGDGHADLVTANTTDSYPVYAEKLWFFRGHGDGTFDAPTPHDAAGIFPVVDDLNGDGIDDLVFMSGLEGPRRVLFGSHADPLREGALYAAGGFAAPAALGDVNGDGRTDLMLVNAEGSTATFVPGNGDGTFGSLRPISLGPGLGEPAVADFDGDGRLDLAVPGFDESTGSQPVLNLLMGAPGGGFAPVRSMPLSSPAYAAAAGDIDHDGDADLVITTRSSHGTLVLLGGGDGTFHEQPRLADGAPWDLLLDDFNRDGILDLAVSDTGANLIAVHRGLVGGGFGPLQRYGAGNEPIALASADFDGDGAVDLVTVNSLNSPGAPALTLLRGRRDGSFAAWTRLSAGADIPGEVAVGDFDEDGRPDIVVVGDSTGTPPPYGPNALLFLNRDSEGFQPQPPLPVGRMPTHLVAADFDVDGHLDLVVVNSQSDDLSLLRGHGDGTFDPEERYAAGVNPWAVVAGDFTGDGRPDLVVVLTGRDYACCPNGQGVMILPNIAVPDGDGDGIPDADDPCTDVDGDGFGNPGHPANTCPVDNCPRTANPDQADPDHDGAGTACDNCPSFTNPDQADRDRDGVGNACDPCTDTDGDGLGDPGFPANACPADNCPTVPNASQIDTDSDGIGDFCDNCYNVANPGQEDFDRDSIGDVCDTCIDSDRDGRGDPGFPANVCAPDNCPTVGNPSQADADHDGTGDVCDLCTDDDGDGFGDHHLPSDLCAPDNCGGTYNPGQEDSDRDGRADACDSCPFDPLNDGDHDGRCADHDNCPLLFNPDQTDADGDRVGDRCDNCRNAPNPDQGDSNHDGDGDACQPTVTIDAILEDGGEVLEVQAAASDPQGQPLTGILRIVSGSGAREIHLHDNGFDQACSSGYWPAGIAGAGIGFLGDSLGGGQHVLYDVDGVFGCSDGLPDYELALGSCREATHFDYAVDVSGMKLPGQVCIRWRQTTGSFAVTSLTVSSVTGTELVGSIFEPGSDLLYVPFEGALPHDVPIPLIPAGVHYTLAISVTDEETAWVEARRDFLYQGESLLVINRAPHAVAWAAPITECDRPGGALVQFDGSESSDPDATEPGESGIATFEWLERQLDGADPVLLGSGERLTALLSVGVHHIVLRVTDLLGAGDTTEVGVSVVDTTPPAIVCPAVSPAECSGPDGAPVSLLAAATDACSAAVTITNDHGNGGADASGDYPLGLTPLTFVATDAAGNHSTCGLSVEVRDTLPPRLDLVVDPATLWPPNHELVHVGVAWRTSDLCDAEPRVSLVSAGSNEPDDANGKSDGETAGDIAGADPGVADADIQLRAERSGSGAGRAYTLIYAATDISGNRTQAIAVVTVPHDLGAGAEPLLMRLERGAGPALARLYWPAVPDALGYDVISGPLAQLRVEEDHVSLGTVRVLARNLAGTSLMETPNEALPTPGEGFFYMIQPRTVRGGAGYGTESVPLPRQPAACQDGCP